MREGHVRFGLGAVIYLVEAEGRFVRKADTPKKSFSEFVSGFRIRRSCGVVMTKAKHAQRKTKAGKSRPLMFS